MLDRIMHSLPSEIQEGTYTWNVAKRAQECGYKVEIVRDRFYVAKLTLLINYRRCKLHRPSDKRKYTAKASTAIDVHIFRIEEEERVIHFLIPAKVLHETFPATAKYCLTMPGVASPCRRERQQLWASYRDHWGILQEPVTAR